MAHFAQIDDTNTVVQVIVAEQDFINSGAVGPADKWIQTSYNTYAGAHSQGGTPLRKNYAGIGYTYDPARDAFYAPAPFASWTLNDNTCQWEAPTPMPVVEGKIYNWDEATTSWVESTVPE
jgi:hypothetical protein